VISRECLQVANNINFLSCDSENDIIYMANDSSVFGYSFNKSDDIWCFDVTTEESFPVFNRIVGLEVIQGESQLCLALDTGSIVSICLKTFKTELEVAISCHISAMSWSPDQELFLLSSDDAKIIALTRSFDLINEVDLLADQEGKQQFLDVGWGKKETQFQGKGMRREKKESEEVLALKIDTDTNTKIAWLADGQFFATSFVKDNQRMFKVWDRDFELQCISETLPGIESSFDWKPSGSFLATTQRKENEHNVTLFEMNGLKHSEFSLPCSPDELIIWKIEWSVDSSILMLVYEKNSNYLKNSEFKKSGILLWSFSNYHWSLKQHFSFDHRVMVANWDLECPKKLHLVIDDGLYYQYDLTTCISASLSNSQLQLPAGSSYVAVIDSKDVKLTPFYFVNVPPPMCWYKIKMKEQVQCLCFCQSYDYCDNMAVLTSNLKISLFSDKNVNSDFISEASIELDQAHSTSDLLPYLNCYFQLDLSEIDGFKFTTFQHFIWPTSNVLLGVTTCNEESIVAIDITNPSNPKVKTSCVFEKVINICCRQSSCNDDEQFALVLLKSGQVLKYLIKNNQLTTYYDNDENPVVLSDPSTNMQIIPLSTSEDTFKLLALSIHGKLTVDNEVINTECTSFTISKDFILFTTSSHQLISMPLSSFHNSLPQQIAEPIKRSLERGSVIVAHSLHLTSVVLQLPRGNLETIHPRSLVVFKVRKLLDASLYADAFEIMRKHRINLNLIYDNSPNTFLNEIKNFVSQIQSIERLNMFITDLKDENVVCTMYKKFYADKLDEDGNYTVANINKVDTICNKLIDHFNTLPIHQIIIPCITAHVKKSSPEIKEALIKVQSLKELVENPNDLISKAIRYLVILVDGNTLYKESLGTYDLELALMVAQASNDDPKEYMAFLNELSQMEENFRRYRIDIYIKQFNKALKHLSMCPDKFSNCLELIRKHELYSEALSIYPKNTDEGKQVVIMYSEYLVSKNLYNEAGVFLLRSKLYERALACFFQTSTCWRHVLTTAKLLKYDNAKYSKLAIKVAEKLTDGNKFVEAAEVYKDHLGLYKESVNCLIKAELWEKSLQVIYSQNIVELIDSLFKPSLLESCFNLKSNINSAFESFQKYRNRLVVVREKKLKDAENLLMNGGAGDFDSDVASCYGSIITSSSRQSTLSSRATTSRRRRKLEKKKFSLKQGSRFEEEGLLDALHLVYLNMSQLIQSVSCILQNLTLQDLDVEAKELQDVAQTAVKAFKSDMSTIWPISPEQQNEFTPHPLSSMCSKAETLEDIRVFLPPKISFSKFEMNLYSS